MITAYKIGVEILVGGNVTKAISDLARQFAAIDVAIKRMQESLTALQPGMDRIGKAGREAAQAWREAAAAMERAGRAAPSATAGSGATSSGASSGSSAPLRLAQVGVAASMLGSGGSGGGVPPSVLRLTNGPGGGGGGGGAGGGGLAVGGGGGGGGGGGMGLGLAAGGVAGAALGGHNYAMAAAGYGAVGSAIFSAERQAIDAAGEISHLRAILLAQGVSAGAADEGIETARRIARTTPGLTTEQSLDSLMDLKSVLGGTAWNPASLDPAVTALPAFARTMSLLNAIGKNKGDPTFAAAKAQELLGHLIDEKTGGVSAEELQKHLDATSQVAVATKNRVSPTDYLAAVKQARISGLMLNDEALYHDMPALIMEMTGSRAGTGLAAFGRQFMAGTMTEGKFNELQKIHVFDSSAKWKGGHVADAEKHIAGHAAAYENPAEWVWKTLIPLLDAAKIHGRLNQAKYIAQIASTAVGGGFLSSLITQEPAIQKEAANIKASQKGGAALNTMYNQDFTLQVANFQAAFHNLMTDLGGPMLKDAATLLSAVTAGMNLLGQWAHNNPDLAHRLEQMATALALFAAGSAAYSAIIFMGGPMLLVAKGIGGFMASIPGAGAVSNVLLLLSRLTGFMTFLYGMKPSSLNDNESEILRKYRESSPEQQQKSMLQSSWAPQPGDQGAKATNDPVHVIVKNIGDMANGTMSYIANKMSRPGTGTPSTDLRVGPPMPGLPIGAVQ